MRRRIVAPLKRAAPRPTTPDVPRSVPIPRTPLPTPLSVRAFHAHLPIAIEAGPQLALVLVRADASPRGRRRLEAALRTAGGFAYELPGGHALLLPGATGWEALKLALRLRRKARAYLPTGIAVLEDGDTAMTLFARAHRALEQGGVQVAAPRVAPLEQVI